MTLTAPRRRLPATLVAAALGLVALVAVAPATLAQPSTWNAAQADVAAAQPLGNGGAGVVVAVVDSWVDGRSQAEFGGRVLPGADCASGTCTAGAAAGDDCIHGTHVAGIVGSASYGVAPKATILPVRVLTWNAQDGDCEGATAAVAAGIDWARTHGAQVINLSLGDVPLTGLQLVDGFFHSTDVDDAVARAAQAGIVVVSAAGNNSQTTPSYQAGNALLVAATGPTGAIASYSDSGGATSVAAPGGDFGSDGQCHPETCVVSTTPNNTYTAMAGTSMAAPHVAGLAALLLAEHPGRGRADVFSTIESTAKPLAGAGHGLIDAAAALLLHPPDATSSGSFGFTGCRKVVTATKGTRATVRCAVRPAAANVTVALQQKKGSGWITIATTRTNGKGVFTLRSKAIRSTTKLRLVTHKTVTFAVTAKVASKE
ncbi:MAG TPA: S8 family serine peptidase [Mycobacteriales bacterium]|nr:S8 family serine peptidase [Mycobacteriales bacterium]